MIARLKTKFTRLFNYLSYIFLVGIFALINPFIMRVRYEGTENIPKKGRFIFASNHQNFFDGFLLANVLGPLKKINFLISKRPLKNAFTLSLVKSIGPALIGSGAEEYQKALKKLNNYLAHGGIIGIFPEGIVTSFDIPQKFKGGVAKLSIDSKSSVIPIHISGSYKLRFVKNLIKRPEITIKFGKPIDLYNYAPDYGNNLDKLAAILREKVIELYEPRFSEIEKIKSLKSETLEAVAN